MSATQVLTWADGQNLQVLRNLSKSTNIDLGIRIFKSEKEKSDLEFEEQFGCI